LETARQFLSQGWNVIATMRTPRADLLPLSERVRVLPLDVTDHESVSRIIERVGHVDVLVNNAGIGLFGAMEVTPMATVREIFETNTLGVIAMCQAVIPQFRERRAGTIINITSTVCMEAMPLVATYTASKTAIAGFTASLKHELEPFGVRVKLVAPGYGPSTSFTSNCQQRIQGLIPPPYEALARRVFAGMAHYTDLTRASDVAEAIYGAAISMSGQLHYPAGADAVALARRRSQRVQGTGCPLPLEF
jgi:NAD(P)-dependent dehydrogenase (short-subunit alcohol dehydrogenase family)